MAIDLEPHGVAAASIRMGILKTDRMWRAMNGNPGVRRLPGSGRDTAAGSGRASRA